MDPLYVYALIALLIATAAVVLAERSASKGS